MMSKANRQSLLATLLRAGLYSDQQSLCDALRSRGCKVTQATISRDLEDLGVRKVRKPNGKDCYVLPMKLEDDVLVEEQTQQTSRKALSLEFSGRMGLIKTRPALAQALAMEIDAQNSEIILGTIAGYDTVLVIPRDGYDKEALAHYLQAFL